MIGVGTFFAGSANSGSAHSLKNAHSVLQVRARKKKSRLNGSISVIDLFDILLSFRCVGGTLM